MFHRSENLFLRPAWPEDAAEIFAGIGEEAIVRNLARAPWPYALDDARQWAALPQDPQAPGFLVVLPGSAGEQVIGGAGLGREGETVELGYWIARPYWGRGYATEAARSVLKIARMLGHQRIEASHFVDNPASGRVLTKLGFRPTGRVAPRYSRGRGGEAPCSYYEIDLEGDAVADMPKAA